MIHIYEVMNGNIVSWEVWREFPGIPWSDELFLSIYQPDTYAWYLDTLRSEGLDFVIHEWEGEDEYNIALPSV